MAGFCSLNREKPDDAGPGDAAAVLLFTCRDGVELGDSAIEKTS
jgi:hypothetical protein